MPYARRRSADAIAEVPPAQWSRFRRDMRRVTTEPTTRHQRRSLATIERGIAYGRTPTAIIKPGNQPRLEITAKTHQTPGLTT